MKAFLTWLQKFTKKLFVFFAAIDNILKLESFKKWAIDRMKMFLSPRN